MQFGLGGRDDASYQCDLEIFRVGNVATCGKTSVNVDFVVSGRPGASSRCAETGTLVYAPECNEGCAASSQWFWIPDVSC